MLKNNGHIMGLKKQNMSGCEWADSLSYDFGLTITLTQTVESGAPFLHFASLHSCKKGTPLSTAGYAGRYDSYEN